MINFACGFVFGFLIFEFIFEPIFINFVYFTNLYLFEDIILTKKNKQKIRDFYRNEVFK